MSRPQEYFFKEGCYIEEWHNTPTDSNCSVARARVEANSSTKLHLLKSTVERYVVLQGRALVTVGSQSFEVSEGDVVVIPADTPQKLENGSQSEFIFLAICTPRFLEANYKNLEEEA